MKKRQITSPISVEKVKNHQGEEVVSPRTPRRIEENSRIGSPKDNVDLQVHKTYANLLPELSSKIQAVKTLPNESEKSIVEMPLGNVSRASPPMPPLELNKKARSSSFSFTSPRKMHANCIQGVQGNVNQLSRFVQRPLSRENVRQINVHFQQLKLTPPELTTFEGLLNSDENFAQNIKGNLLRHLHELIQQHYLVICNHLQAPFTTKSNLDAIGTKLLLSRTEIMKRAFAQMLCYQLIEKYLIKTFSTNKYTLEFHFENIKKSINGLLAKDDNFDKTVFLFENGEGKRKFPGVQLSAEMQENYNHLLNKLTELKEAICLSKDEVLECTKKLQHNKKNTSIKENYLQCITDIVEIKKSYRLLEDFMEVIFSALNLTSKKYIKKIIHKAFLRAGLAESKHSPHEKVLFLNNHDEDKTIYINSYLIAGLLDKFSNPKKNCHNQLKSLFSTENKKIISNNVFDLLKQGKSNEIELQIEKYLKREFFKSYAKEFKNDELDDFFEKIMRNAITQEVFDSIKSYPITSSPIKEGLCTLLFSVVPNDKRETELLKYIQQNNISTVNDLSDEIKRKLIINEFTSGKLHVKKKNMTPFTMKLRDALENSIYESMVSSFNCPQEAKKNKKKSDHFLSKIIEKGVFNSQKEIAGQIFQMEIQDFIEECRSKQPTQEQRKNIMEIAYTLLQKNEQEYSQLSVSVIENIDNDSEKEKNFIPFSENYSQIDKAMFRYTRVLLALHKQGFDFNDPWIKAAALASATEFYLLLEGEEAAFREWLPRYVESFQRMLLHKLLGTRCLPFLPDNVEIEKKLLELISTEINTLEESFRKQPSCLSIELEKAMTKIHEIFYLQILEDSSKSLEGFERDELISYARFRLHQEKDLAKIISPQIWAKEIRNEWDNPLTSEQVQFFIRYVLERVNQFNNVNELTQQIKLNIEGKLNNCLSSDLENNIHAVIGYIQQKVQKVSLHGNIGNYITLILNHLQTFCNNKVPDLRP